MIAPSSYRRRLSIDPEVILWRALTESFPRARFMRRVQIGPYVADFVSRVAKLIVEVDDGRHRGQRGSARTRLLNRHGYRLIRFWDEDVIHDVEAVLDALACALPPEMLDGSGAKCRISGPATRAEWSPRPDFPPPPEPAPWQPATEPAK
jgi:very-short-patch-repair endonuclease